ncbi:hypothetical protein JMJ35_005205 [Cladonia borealis]|uniref:Uncharacterized protein n=1 Tax=Cladonia borealis TaxID=184061 RepID=A0AA39QZD8_9LECA|nr:hypothetical protein JMJ35_005205 [Cladonia borealis]
MCYVDTHICTGCGHTQHLSVRVRCMDSQWTIPVQCSGSTSVRAIRFHKGEYCIFCYHKALRRIEKHYRKEMDALYAEAGAKGLSDRLHRKREETEADRKWKLDELSREWLDKQMVEDN